MSYRDDVTVRSLRFPARPRTLLQSSLKTVGTGHRGLGLGQPVAEVLVYLHVQISPISCNVVRSILHVLGKNTDTAIVGYRWTGVGGHRAPVLLTGVKKSGVPD